MLTDEQIVDGWFPHDGGPCPVAEETWVRPLYRGAADTRKGQLRPVGFGSDFAWQHDGAEDDIIAYRPEPTP